MKGNARSDRKKPGPSGLLPRVAEDRRKRGATN